MDVNRSLITYTEDAGDGNLVVHGADGHGNQTTVHCGRDKVADGTVYLMLDKALDKVRQTREHLGMVDRAEAEER